MSFAEAGAVVRNARKQAKLSQAEVAKQLGMSRTTVSQIEAGTIPELGIRKYVALCELLGLAFVIGPRTAPSWDELKKQNAEQSNASARATDKAIAQAFTQNRRVP